MTVPVPRQVRVENGWLACVFQCGSLGMFLIGIVYFLVILQGNRLPMTMTSSVALHLSSPPNVPPLSALPHCLGSTSTETVPEQLSCSFWDSNMLVTSRGDASLSVATFFEVTNQSRPLDPECQSLARPSCAYTNIASKSYFVAYPEYLFLILKVEAIFTGGESVQVVTLDRAQGSICDSSAGDLQDLSTIGSCGSTKTIDPCEAYTDIGLDCPQEVDDGDAIPLGSLLKAATGSSKGLDRENEDGIVDRRTGIKLQLLMEFSNANTDNTSDITYIIRPRIVRASAGNTISAAEAFPSGSKLPGIAPTERSVIKIGNLQVEVVTASDVSYASISQAFVVLMSAFGFVATFRTIFQALIPLIIDQRNATHVEYTLSNVALFDKCGQRHAAATHTVEAPGANATDSDEVELTPKAESA